MRASGDQALRTLARRDRAGAWAAVRTATSGAMRSNSNRVSAHSALTWASLGSNPPGLNRITEGQSPGRDSVSTQSSKIVVAILSRNFERDLFSQTEITTASASCSGVRCFMETLRNFRTERNIRSSFSRNRGIGATARRVRSAEMRHQRYSFARQRSCVRVQAFTAAINNSCAGGVR